jgi:hypothetical protein
MLACVAAALFLMNSPVSTQSQSPSQSGDDVASAVGEEPQLFTTLSGGALTQIRMRASDTPVLQAPLATFTSLVGATLPWTIAANGSDLIHISFSAECQLRRNGAAPSIFDWIEVRALISAVPARAGYPKLMAPFDAGSPKALCGSEEYNSVAVTYADRPTPVPVLTTYTVTIQTRVVDNAPVSVPALTGWLDDYVIELRAYN